jgi:ATP-dependent DNA ligase
MIDMELTLGGGYTMKQALAVSSMSPNTKPERAKDIYKTWLENNPKDFLTAIVFDVIFFNGSPVIQLPYEERYRILESFIPYNEKDKPHHNGNFFSYIVRPYVFKDFHEANKKARDNGWEGLVLWDKEMTSEYTVNGKPRRLKGCWKWKTDRMADCVVLDVFPQEGNDKLVGALALGQYDEKENIVKCGNVGSGINEVTEIEAWEWKGKVVEIKFFERMPENDKGEFCFQFPVIIGLKKDKTPKECIFDEDES